MVATAAVVITALCAVGILAAFMASLSKATSASGAAGVPDQVVAVQQQKERALETTREAVHANAKQIAAVLTRDAKAEGAVTVASYVQSLGRTERQIDRALAVKFAGADVIVDYVVTDPAPVIRVWHEEDYKVSVNISNSTAEVFTPIG